MQLLNAAWIKVIPLININPKQMDKCQQKARVDVLQGRGTTSLRSAPGYLLPVKLLTAGICSSSSSIYGNASTNNSGVAAAACRRVSRQVRICLEWQTEKESKWKKKEKYLQGLVTGRRKFIQRDWLFLFCNTNCNTARGSASENHNTQWMPLHLNADWRDATDASDTRETATAMSFPPLQKGCLPYTICKKS